MALSAAVMIVAGVTATFLPQELLAAIGAPVSYPLVLIVQVTAALYLGFGFMNWTARGVLLGGIYARPLALGNFLHFAAMAVALLKSVATIGSPPVYVAVVIYVVFAAWFGKVLFTSPV